MIAKLLKSFEEQLAIKEERIQMLEKDAKQLEADKAKCIIPLYILVNQTYTKRTSPL